MTNNINKLLSVSRDIVIALKDESCITLTDKEKESLENTLESMQFFSEEGNLDRAISEGELVLKKINKSKQ